jgi:hypothetical protein
MEGGPVDPTQYSFHLHFKLETGHDKYKWMNDRVIIGLLEPKGRLRTPEVDIQMATHDQTH